jgi:hypothetical protein
MKAYILPDKLDFGKYKGETLKEVFIKDPYYIQWCMAEMNNFVITEKTIEFLKRVKKFNFNNVSYNKNISKLKSYQSSAPKAFVSKSKHRVHTSSNYEDYSCSKYGGYNGYDDSAIDNAFEGDPSLTWNCD